MQRSRDQYGKYPLAKLVGDDVTIKTATKIKVTYSNLDNAATTPPFQKVWEYLEQIIPFYGSIHRGAGFKSVLSTSILEKSIAAIYEFCEGNPDKDILLFGSNATTCINSFARRFELGRGEKIVINESEHTSNILPWRKKFEILECRSDKNGKISIDHLTTLLKSNNVRLVVTSAASNITGSIFETNDVAEVAHNFGSEIFVDASQLAPHRKIRRNEKDSMHYIDYLVFSAHKMYAPFGLGVLIADNKIFKNGWPDNPGGGSIKFIDSENIIWGGLQEREYGGTPNYVGIAALAKAIECIVDIGFENIRKHEQALLLEAIGSIMSIEGLIMQKDMDFMRNDSVAIFPFTLEGYHHSLVSSYLGFEHGIGVRAGHICQFNLMKKIFEISEREYSEMKSIVNNGDSRNMPGIVRASCGVGSTKEEISKLANALIQLKAEGPQLKYIQHKNGSFSPEKPISMDKDAMPHFL